MAVLGAGGWGTALAVHLARAGHNVQLWARDEELVSKMRSTRTNTLYLPEVIFPKSLQVESSLEVVLSRANLVVAALPSHGMREVLRKAAPMVPPSITFVSAAKGLEQGTLFRMSEVIEQERGTSQSIAVLSGPSFAPELARELPTAVSVASREASTLARVQNDFRTSCFRLYGSDDIIGVEVGGSLKNVIAIAAGVVEGLGLGHNAIAGLITRGLAEMTRLACAAGAKRETLSGLSGLGDLVLTCTGKLSRNRNVGLELARGLSLEDILANMKMVAEGVRTTEAALTLGEKYNVELPISTQVAELLAGRKDPRAAVDDLMLRPQRAESG
jgi:glycerol-3-phosphate dehydrogenase (NAD(P)+)